MGRFEKLVLGLVGVMGVTLVVLVLVFSHTTSSNRAQLLALQNQIAERDRTIEVQKGLYEKLAVQTKDVKGTLDQKDVQVRELEDQVKKQKQDLLDASAVIVQWKKAYEGLANATQTNVPSTTQVASREKVDFHEDFGYIKVDGWTITNPPQAWVRLTQGRPLRLTLALAQDEAHAWHTYVTSSEQNMQVDVQVSSVNPYLFQPKWYENIGVDIDLGAGTNQSGLGALFGAGLSYRFMQFSLGPHVWLGLNDRVDRYYGVTFEWRPFQRK